MCYTIHRDSKELFQKKIGTFDRLFRPARAEEGVVIMKIQFSSKNMTVPDRVYSHAEQRINELEPLFRGAPEATVVFSAENGKHVIELTIFSGSTVFRVVEKTSDMDGFH